MESAGATPPEVEKSDLPFALRPLDRLARHMETPCGQGEMCWRVWGEGPPLLILHGGSGSWMHWARNIMPLARTSTVIAPDLPGLGQSARPSEPEQLSSYAQPIVQGLKQVIGLTTPVDIVAFSFGSIVTGELLSHPTLRMGKLVLVGPSALGVTRLDGALVPVRHLQGEARRCANAKNLETLMFANPAKIDDTAIDIQDWHSRHTRTNSPVFARTTSLREALQAWGRPFAAIAGEKDATSQPSLIGPVLRSLYPAVRYRLLQGVGHWCMYEAAAEFNAALANALTKQ